MNKFFDNLTKFEKLLSSIGITTLTIFIIIDIFSRELFKVGIPWAQKSSVYLMIWAGFIGAALTSEKAIHLRPEIADKLWEKISVKLFVRVQNFIIAAFCATLAFYSIKYVQETKEFGDVNVIIRTPMWILQIILPYTFISMTLRHIRYVLDPDLAIKRKEENS